MGQNGSKSKTLIQRIVRPKKSKKYIHVKLIEFQGNKETKNLYFDQYIALDAALFEDALNDKRIKDIKQKVKEKMNTIGKESYYVFVIPQYNYEISCGIVGYKYIRMELDAMINLNGFSKTITLCIFKDTDKNNVDSVLNNKYLIHKASIDVKTGNCCYSLMLNITVEIEFDFSKTLMELKKRIYNEIIKNIDMANECSKYGITYGNLLVVNQHNELFHDNISVFGNINYQGQIFSGFIHSFTCYIIEGYDTLTNPISSSESSKYLMNVYVNFDAKCYDFTDNFIIKCFSGNDNLSKDVVTLIKEYVTYGRFNRHVYFGYLIMERNDDIMTIKTTIMNRLEYRTVTDIDEAFLFPFDDIDFMVVWEYKDVDGFGFKKYGKLEEESINTSYKNHTISNNEMSVLLYNRGIQTFTRYDI